MLKEDLSEIFERCKVSLKALQSSNLLLTGATGYIGTSILKTIHFFNERSSSPLQVWAVSRNPQLFLSQNPSFKGQTWLHWITVDLSKSPLPSLTEKIDMVLHAAGSDQGDAKALDAANFLVTQNLLAGLQAASAKNASGSLARFVFLSSGAANGFSDYGKAKRNAELLIERSPLWKCSCIARIYGLYGGDLSFHRHYAITQFLQRARAGEQIIIEGDGSPERSYLYITDLVVWLFRMLNYAEPAKIYDVGSNQGIKLRELASLVDRRYGRNLGVHIQGKAGFGSAQKYIPSLTEVSNLFFDKSLNRLDVGLEKYWRYQTEKSNQ